MVSLKQIGAELGIDYTLVSKVLRGRMGTTGVSAKTRAAILAKAREMDYRPNAMAVALKNGRRGAVGVFMHEMGEPGSELTHTLLRSIASVLSASSERLWLRFFSSDNEFLESCDERLRHDVDGLIVVGVHHPGITKRLQAIEKTGLPLVSAHSGGRRGPSSGSVTVDNELQGYLPTRHLLEKGCRRLVHFRNVEARYRGFVRAHEEAGVPFHEEMALRVDEFDAALNEAVIESLVSTGLKFDGIVGQSDSQGLAAMRVLARHGIRTPEQVRITGVDNSPIADLCPIPLTSVTSEMEECGRIATELLLRIVAGGPASAVSVAPRLVERESSR